MQASHHTLTDLFDQLGLPNDEASIRQFIEDNQFSQPDQALESLPVWNESQKQFLLESRTEDAEWSEPVDELDAMLRG